MSTHAFRNFTVRMTESGLQRIDARAKPFYGGRLSTGEAIRRLAEERLDQIENQETVEPGRDVLLRILRNWRSGRAIPLEDIQILAIGATAAYRSCQADFVSRDLVISSISALRETVLQSARGQDAANPPLVCNFDMVAPARKANGSDFPASFDRWIDELPDLVSPAEGELASRNFSAALRHRAWPDEAQLCRALAPHVSALLQLAIRGYWYEKQRPLLAPRNNGQPTPPCQLDRLQEGPISLEATVGEHELWLVMELPDRRAAVLANNVVEAQDLRNVTRLALENCFIRGETFRCFKECAGSEPFLLSTGCCWWRLGGSDLASIAEGLDSLFRDPSIANLAARSQYIYGRV